MSTAVSLVAVFAILLTFTSFSLHTHWLIRVGDFPRLQIIKLLLPTIVANIYFSEPVGIIDRLFTFALVSCLLYQLSWIIPLTIFFPKESSDATSEKSPTIRVMVFNILKSNRSAEQVIEYVQNSDADIVLLAEPDKWWAERLEPLKQLYPYAVFEPLENCFGMVLLSRLELSDTETHFLVQGDIPSIHTKVKLADGREFAFHGLHPRPPSPTDEGRSTARDAELLLVAEAVREQKLPAIVAGDLNDVPWSATARLFKKIGGLLDPRIGRGFYNSFHTKNLLCRFPLDHILHTGHFRVAQIRRARKSHGSDHFPIIVELTLEPANHLTAPEPTPSETKRAGLIIGRAFAFKEKATLQTQIAALKARIARTS
jgi:endonuclease/exonuclease/phosphatase (EEP) superfamily protein YafD